MSQKNKSCALNPKFCKIFAGFFKFTPLTPLARGAISGIFAGFLLLNVSVVNAGDTTGSTNTNNLVAGASNQIGWENGVPSAINTSYFQGLDVDNTDASPIYGMSQGYYNYINNWQNYKNVTPVALEKKIKASDEKATATSPYVFADEFNTIVGALRGIWNAVSGSEHFFGINGEPTDGVRLSVHGAVQLGVHSGGICDANFAGSLYFDTDNSHFYYCNGTDWRQLDTPDCNSCTAYEYTCTDDGDNDETGVWVQGAECSPANFDASGGTTYYSQSSDTVCSADDMSTPEAEALCSTDEHGGDPCKPVVDHYETRCDTATNRIYWYNDCGELASSEYFVEACANGCHDVVDYSACFVAGTQITMADGSKKNIEAVQIGEKIRGISGVNTVVGFHRPLLGKKALYAFNDGEAFVTAEHPFMTTDGWKALDPKLAKSVHLDIEIGQLAVGDTLITETGEVKLEKISFTLPNGLGRRAPTNVAGDFVSAETQLYNFKLDGDHTYIADGFVVHNKVSCNYGDCNCVDLDQDGSCDYHSYPLAGRTGYCSLNGVDHTDMACAFKRECTEALGDDAATCEGMTHPMHPQYSSDQACASGEVGCGTGSSWGDPYHDPKYPDPNDPDFEDIDKYMYLGNSSFYDSPRVPNLKFAGICNDSLACGDAANIIGGTDEAPTTNLCSGIGTITAGSVSLVISGTEPGKWQWSCSNDSGNTIICSVPFYDWMINDWGQCEKEIQERTVCCTDGYQCLENNDACMSAGAADGTGAFVRGGYDAAYRYLDADNDGVPDTSRGCGQCTGTIPDHASMCTDDDQGLTQDTPYTLVSSCDASSVQTKCETVCDTGFHLDGGTCVADDYHWSTDDDPSWGNCTEVAPGYCAYQCTAKDEYREKDIYIKNGDYNMDGNGTFTGKAREICATTANNCGDIVASGTNICELGGNPGSTSCPHNGTAITGNYSTANDCNGAKCDWIDALFEQNRTVVCHNQDEVVVADSNCPSPKPADSQSCDYQCTGTIADHAGLCYRDDQGLTQDTPYTLVNSCTAGTKCETVCDNHYHKDGNACVLNTCQGTDPANSTLCTDDNINLSTNNINKTAVDACTNGTKCEAGNNNKTIFQNAFSTSVRPQPGFITN